jgi:hypothetical protein
MFYPAHLMHLETGAGRTFTVGGRQYRSGGFYSPATDTVHLHPGVLTSATTELQVRGIVAHEVTHSHFQYHVLQHHATRSGSWASRAWKPPKRGEFGTPTDKINAFIKKNRAALRAKDGVTSYSRSYWRQAETRTAEAEAWEARLASGSVKDVKEGKKVLTQFKRDAELAEFSAINETAAEVSYLEVAQTKGDDAFGLIDDIWISFQEMLTGFAR